MATRASLGGQLQSPSADRSLRLSRRTLRDNVTRLRMFMQFHIFINAIEEMGTESRDLFRPLNKCEMREM